MTSALILAAGFGKRLRPLTLELPKPVVPVGDRPLLAHIARACQAAGSLRLFANAHHGHEKLVNIIRDLMLDIEVMVEDEIRGTAGGVAGGRPYFEPGAVLVWNGDILTEAPVQALMALAGERDAQVLAVSPRPLGEGSVGVDVDGSVVRLRGKLFGREARGGDYIGVMALGPSVVAGLPERGCLIADVAMPELARGGKVWTVPSSAPWSDLGDLRAYVSANFEWLHARGEGSWLGQGVSVARGVTVERCLLGAGAKLSGTGAVTEVIAWPGAALSAPLSRAVVLGSGLVVPFDGSAEN